VPFLDHVTIRASDLDASVDFYRVALRETGFEAAPYESDLGAEWNDFSIGPATLERPPTRRLHLAFAAPSRAHVDRFHAALTGAGYRSDGEPGPRPQYRDDYYGAFVLDPDGHNVEAVLHDRRGGEPGS
jgi:catechol 2,3-dioxygenase-like lactoylglutathione lyase family enzyme